MLSGCVSCNPNEVPTTDRVECWTKTIGQKVVRQCYFTCPRKTYVNNRRQFYLTCRCPRVDGVRQCSWRTSFSSQRRFLTADDFQKLTCSKETPKIDRSRTTRVQVIRPTSSVQKKMDQWCTDLAETNLACSRVKFARYSGFELRCFEKVYDRLSLGCTDDTGNQQLCQAADVSSQKCTRNTELQSFVPHVPVKQPSEFLLKCLLKFQQLEDYEDTAQEMCKTIDQMNIWRRQYQVPEFEGKVYKLGDRRSLCDFIQSCKSHQKYQTRHYATTPRVGQLKWQTSKSFSIHQ